MIGLDIGRTPMPPSVKDDLGRCPQCRAPKSRRINAGGFGAKSPIVLCEECGYEFKETA